MKTTSFLVTAACLLPTLAFTADLNLSELVQSSRIEVLNCMVEQTKAGTPEVAFLNAATNDGVAWISGD